MLQSFLASKCFLRCQKHLNVNSTSVFSGGVNNTPTSSLSFLNLKFTPNILSIKVYNSETHKKQTDQIIQKILYVK